MFILLHLSFLIIDEILTLSSIILPYWIFYFLGLVFREKKACNVLVFGFLF